MEREKQKADTHNELIVMSIYDLLRNFGYITLLVSPTVANDLCPGRPVAVRRYEMETLLFSGIVEGSPLFPSRVNEILVILHSFCTQLRPPRTSSASRFVSYKFKLQYRTIFL